MKTISELLADWRSSSNQMKKVTDSLPRIIGNVAVREVKRNFTIQGYDSGTGVDAWQPRKAVTNAAYDKRSGVKGSVYNSSSPILMQTRNLYNAVKYIVTGKVVTIGVDLTLVPYGEKMNEGGPGKWGKNATTNTPARKYMPTPSEPPNAKILLGVRKKLQFEIDNALNPFKK